MSRRTILTTLSAVMIFGLASYAQDNNDFVPIMINDANESVFAPAAADTVQAAVLDEPLAQQASDANFAADANYASAAEISTAAAEENISAQEQAPETALTAEVNAAQDSNAPDLERETMALRLQTRISVDFVNTPIEDVLRLMAEQADVDLVKSPKVVGTVTARLTDVPLEEALTNILAINGYGFITTKNMIRVAPMSEISEKTELQMSKIYRITYADVKEVEKSLKKFVSKSGSISANPGTSNVIVTDTEGKIRAIDSFIEEIDRITPQVLVEARIYDITNKDRLDIGVDWFAGTQTKLPTPADPTYSGTDPFMGGNFSSTTAKTANTTGTFRFGWITDSVDIDAVIKAQQEEIGAKLLANPRVLVLDNEKAEFKIVQQKPYLQLNQGGGNSQLFGTTDFKEVGVTLEVIPHVTRDGLIRLQLKPKFSTQTDSVIFNVDGVAYPQPVIDERMGDTTLLIKDAQTVVLGGLQKQDVAKQINKIPILGDLPLVGIVFRFEGEEVINSELVVFITPKIIETPTMNELEQKHYDYTNYDGPKPIATNLEKDIAKRKNKK